MKDDITFLAVVLAVVVLLVIAIRINAKSEVEIQAIKSGLIQQYVPGSNQPIWTKP